jgi:hypothetical protein
VATTEVFSHGEVVTVRATWAKTTLGSVPPAQKPCPVTVIVFAV